MTPHQHALIIASYEALLPRLLPTVTRFYERLFAWNPALRARFPADLRRQEFKFMDMLSVAVSCLDMPEAVQPSLWTLGMRHTIYGVTAQDYEMVRAVLLEALAESLGADWTPEVETAWDLLYTYLATVMQSGAANPFLVR